MDENGWKLIKIDEKGGVKVMERGCKSAGKNVGEKCSFYL